MVVIRGRLGSGVGAVFAQALAAARETLYQRARATHADAGPADVSEETPTMSQQHADALALIAETALHHGMDPGTPDERYQVVVHVDAVILADADAPGQSVLEDGTHVPEDRLAGCIRVRQDHGVDVNPDQIGRAHVLTPLTRSSPIPSSPLKKKT